MCDCRFYCRRRRESIWWGVRSAILYSPIINGIACQGHWHTNNNKMCLIIQMQMLSYRDFIVSSEYFAVVIATSWTLIKSVQSSIRNPQKVICIKSWEHTWRNAETSLDDIEAKFSAFNLSLISIYMPFKLETKNYIENYASGFSFDLFQRNFYWERRGVQYQLMIAVDIFHYHF